MNFIKNFSKYWTTGANTNRTILLTWSVCFTRFVVNMAQFTLCQVCIFVWREIGAMWGAWGGAGKDKVTDMSLRYLLPDLCLASGHNPALLLLATTSSQTRLRTQFNHRLRDVQFESFRQDHLYVGAQQNPWGGERRGWWQEAFWGSSSPRHPHCAQCAQLIDGLTPSSSQ